MKKLKRMLAGLFCAVMLCTFAPAAFADKVFINYDPNGGSCDVLTALTSAEGKLGSLPTPTQKGYNFDGWYIAGTDEVTGAEIDVKVTTDTVFKMDSTVYAHWTANGGAVDTVKENQPVTPANAAMTFGLAAGSVLVVLVVSVML